MRRRYRCWSRRSQTFSLTARTSGLEGRHLISACRTLHDENCTVHATFAVLLAAWNVPQFAVVFFWYLFV